MNATTQPEQAARREIDRLLAAAGWAVQDVAGADLAAARGVAIREFPLLPGFGFADYLLYVDGKACGVIEAKKQGATLTGVEAQSARYAQGLPPALPAWRRPLPFVYESTGIETHFTNGLDPAPRARPVFAFHRPETLADWLAQASAGPPGGADHRRPAAAGRGAEGDRRHDAGPASGHATAAHRMERLQALAGADHRHPQPREQPHRQQAARADPVRCLSDAS